MARRVRGIQYRGDKYRAAVRVNGKLHVSKWGQEPLEDLKTWRDDQVQKFGGECSTTAGSFGAEIEMYLGRVSAMPTYRQRAAHLELWAQALGRDRPRRTITSDEIDIVLQGWLETLAPGTVKKRRTALQSFFTKMNGQKSRLLNPVKGAAIPEEPKAEARHVDHRLIEHALAHMAERRWTNPKRAAKQPHPCPAPRETGVCGRPARTQYCSTACCWRAYYRRKGQPAPSRPTSVSRAPGPQPGARISVCLARVRAGVLAHTGIPPGLLKKILPHDLVLVGTGTVRVSARKKGGGVAARTLPLTPEGLAAFKVFHSANAYGKFATESVNRSFKRGCEKAGLDPKSVHLYDLRHSFLTDLYRVTKDLATVGRMGLHAAGSKVTARYAMGANEEVDTAAVAALSAGWAIARQQQLKSVPDPQSAEKLPAKVTKNNKPININDLRKRA